MKQVQFKQYTCRLKEKTYFNGRKRIDLVDGRGTVAVATVNLPEVQLEPGEVIIKDWSENTGMVESLVNAGVVAPPHRTVNTGHVEAKICKLLI